ncbi:MAG: chemotaxis protein CheZ [Variibacter sp.]|jgi:chemotaxis protein CheZ|nr:chemotaxis protein CheZ [Variibacter sp.]
MAARSAERLEAIVAQLKRRSDDDASLADIVNLAEITARSLQSFFASLDSTIYRELREIADYIADTKREIGALQVNELKNARIPAAGLELGRIVAATEKATDRIMECAEAVMGADVSDPAAYKAFVDERMTVIFEACSFQDITGQRIAKVVETLDYIEARVTRFAAAVQAKDLGAILTESERAREDRRQSLLLHGPQDEVNAMKQPEVDSLLAAKTSVPNAQADIDRFFE